MKKPKVWINAKFVDMDKARISIFDRGFLYGDGAFETMRSYAGMVFMLDEHIERLFLSLKAVRIRPPCSKGCLKDAAHRILEINGIKNSYMRVTVTRGEGRFGIGYKDRFKPNIVIVAKEFEGYPAWMYDRGISVKIAAVRQNEYSPLSNIKSLNFLNYILARFEAQEKGCDEAVLLNTKGYIAEGATSNVFLVKKNRIITPSLDSGTLDGIARGVVLRIAKGLALKAEAGRVPYREIMNADEVFLTNSLAEVLPVTRVDYKKIGRGMPGEVTKLLRISYQKQVIREVLGRA